MPIIVMLGERGACFLLCRSQSKKHLCFLLLFFEVALSRREKGRLKKCYFYFAKENCICKVSFSSLPSLSPCPPVLEERFTGPAISLYLKMSFWTSQNRTGQGSGLIRLVCSWFNKLPANSPRRRPPARLHLTPRHPGAPKRGCLECRKATQGSARAELSSLGRVQSPGSVCPGT